MQCFPDETARKLVMTKIITITVATLSIATLTTAAVAQAPQPYQSRGNFRLTDAGRFHGYVSWPVYCGIAKCGDNWIAKVPVSANGTQAAPGPRARR